MRKLRRPTGLLRAGNGCVDLRHGATLLISRLDGRDATQAMISPASNKARSQVKPAWLGAGTREK